MLGFFIPVANLSSCKLFQPGVHNIKHGTCCKKILKMCFQYQIFAFGDFLKKLYHGEKRLAVPKFVQKRTSFWKTPASPINTIQRIVPDKAQKWKLLTSGSFHMKLLWVRIFATAEFLAKQKFSRNLTTYVKPLFSNCHHLSHITSGSFCEKVTIKRYLFDERTKTS